MVPACIACGYDLAGLPRDSQCPECGLSVERSYAPDLLENRSTEFLMNLRSGLTLVLAGVFASIATVALLLVASILAGLYAPANADVVAIVSQVLELGIAFLILFGWWRITAPDPGRVGRGLDVRPRQVLRAAVIVQVVMSLVQLVLLPFWTQTYNMANPVDLVYLAAQWGHGIAWCTQFFASMLYIKWLARRIPDPKLEADAKRFMWLGPLLYILLGCILIGVIVALVLYIMMLLTLRGHLTAILRRYGEI